MRIQSIKCNPAFTVGEGEVVVTLTDTEVGTITKALEEYTKARPEVMNLAHIKRALNRWQELFHLIDEGIFKEGE